MSILRCVAAAVLCLRAFALLPNPAACSTALPSDDDSEVERDADREWAQAVGEYNELWKQLRYDEALALGKRWTRLQPMNQVAENMVLKAKFGKQDAFNKVAEWIVCADTSPHRSAPDDDNSARADDAEHRSSRGARLSENALDQILFGVGADPTSAKNQLEALLDEELERLGQRCRLTDAQSRKLRLAGRGDIERFSRRVESLRLRFEETYPVIDQDEMPEWAIALGTEVTKLQRVLGGGLFDSGSLFSKSLATTLTAEQVRAYASRTPHSVNSRRLGPKGLVRRR